MKEPEIYYKVKLEQGGRPTRFDFLTLSEINATSRQLLQQVLGGAKYVKIGPGNYQLYDQWKRAQRGKA